MSAQLDIGGRYEDIRRLTYRHPLFRVAIARGHDADDLMQSVLLGLLTRQRSRSAYDPSRANDPARAFAKYVYVVAGSVLANLLDSARRRGKNEQVGMWTGKGDEGQQMDASTAQVVLPEPDTALSELDEPLYLETLAALPRNVAAVARDVMDGMGAEHVCERHGITRPGLARIVARIDSMARALLDGYSYIEDEDEPEPVPMGEQLLLFGAAT